MTTALLLIAALGMARGQPAPKTTKAAVSRSLESKRAAAKQLQPETPEEQARRRIKAWRADPISFVRDQFGVIPDAWQEDALRAVAENPRVAMSACKGPGKSATLAWVVWWFLATNVDAQVVAVSITADNLKDNLWKELAVWRGKSQLLQAAFDFSAERIKSVENPDMWWASARSFAKTADPTEQANSLAGFHSPNVMVVLDEVGDYPPGVLPAAEAIFAVKGQNAKLVVAGNPTSMSGPLHGIVTTDAWKWALIVITGDPDDPKRSPRIDIDWARAEIAKNGRDNPWVMVNILGKFPPAAANQLIGVNLVIEAMKRDAPALAYRSDSIIWGLDPAMFGDDEIALARRQGVVSRRMITWRNKDGPELAVAVSALLLEEEKKRDRGEQHWFPDALFVDRGGNGASCYDHLKLLGWAGVGGCVIGVDFGSSAADASRYANKRTEMWWLLMEWLRDNPSCLPNDPILQAELTAPLFEFRVVQKQTVFMLEPKKDMKKRGVQSPNRADALALTFAAPVAPKSRDVREAESHRTTTMPDYDPLAAGRV